MHRPGPEQITFDAFAERVGKGKTQIEERIYGPLVRIDNDLAMVWAPFEFRVDGKVDHCGADSFNLVRTGGKSIIASLAATVRRIVERDSLRRFLHDMRGRAGVHGS